MLTIYATDHPHSQVVCRALAQGVESRLVPPNSLLDGDAATYGVLRGCGEIIRQCEWIGRTYYHVDHGYIRRGHYDGFYRISKNGLQWDGSGHYPVDRWRALGVEPLPWKRDGRSIVVCPLSTAMGEHFGISPHEWLTKVIAELPKFTDRPVLIKPKGEGNLKDSLADAWCVVAHQSNVAVDAILLGIPAIVLGPSAAVPVARTKLGDVENPNYADRGGWLAGLAYHQWTLAEMREGLPWKWLE